MYFSDKFISVIDLALIKVVSLT